MSVTGKTGRLSDACTFQFSRVIHGMNRANLLEFLKESHKEEGERERWRAVFDS